jgi:aspartate dehydrogenase
MEPQVEIWADPAVSSNQHEIEAQGEFGKVTITTNNLPSPDNPATSYLAALSVLTLLSDLADRGDGGHVTAHNQTIWL